MNRLRSFLIGLLLGVAGLASAQVLYYGFNPVTGLNVMPGIWVDGSAAQTISGCSITALQGGSNAGQFTAGATTCTVTLTDVAAPHGYLCFLNDLTHSVVFHAVTTATTGCQAVGVVTIGDIITYLMIGY